MILTGDSREQLKELQDNTVDLMVTDPPYGYSFMGKDWDKALPDIEIWKECLRVLKPGAFAFIMAAPRQDVLWRMNRDLEEVGFDTTYTSLYHTYATGFPKANNICKKLTTSKEKSELQVRQLWRTIIHSTKSTTEEERTLMSGMLEDLEQGKQHEVYAYDGSEESLPESTSKRQRQSFMERWSDLQKEEGQLCVCKVCKMPAGILINGEKRWLCYGTQISNGSITWQVIDENGVCSSHQSQPAGQQIGKLDVICEQCGTQKIRAFEGSYGGFQSKPAVEVIIVVQKPSTEKTQVGQALDNGKGITWLDDCRIPYSDASDLNGATWGSKSCESDSDQSWGFFKGSKGMKDVPGNTQGRFPANLLVSDDVLDDGKEHKSPPPYKEKRSGFKNEFVGGEMVKPLENPTARYGDSGGFSRFFSLDAWAERAVPEALAVEGLEETVVNNLPFLIVPKASKKEKTVGCGVNRHPTVKPIKLMSYLITMGSRPGEVVLDPFAGSGSTGCAAVLGGRKYILIEREPEYVEILKARIEYYKDKYPLLENR